MKHHINDMKRRALHNADAAYYVLDYLAHSFPVQLYEPFTDSEGNLSSRPVVRDGQPVECREAARRRDALIEKLVEQLLPGRGMHARGLRQHAVKVEQDSVVVARRKRDDPTGTRHAGPCVLRQASRAVSVRARSPWRARHTCTESAIDSARLISVRRLLPAPNSSPGSGSAQFSWPC